MLLLISVGGVPLYAVAALVLTILSPFLVKYAAEWDLKNYKKIEPAFKEEKDKELLEDFKTRCGIELGLFVCGILIGGILCSI